MVKAIGCSILLAGLLAANVYLVLELRAGSRFHDQCQAQGGYVVNVAPYAGQVDLECRGGR